MSHQLVLREMKDLPYDLHRFRYWHMDLGHAPVML